MQRLYEVFATPLPGAPKVGTLAFPALACASAIEPDDSNDMDEGSSVLNRHSSSKASRRRDRMTASGSSRLDDVPIFIYDPAWIENGFPIGADLPLSRDPIRPPKGARTFSFLKERSISEEVFSLIQDENFGGFGNDLSMWRFYNLITGANKSSYIDSFLDRAYNATEIATGINDALHGDKRYSWFID